MSRNILFCPSLGRDVFGRSVGVEVGSGVEAGKLATCPALSRLSHPSSSVPAAAKSRGTAALIVTAIRSWYRHTYKNYGGEKMNANEEWEYAFWNNLT